MDELNGIRELSANKRNSLTKKACINSLVDYHGFRTRSWRCSYVYVLIWYVNVAALPLYLPKKFKFPGRM